MEITDMRWPKSIRYISLTELTHCYSTLLQLPNVIARYNKSPSELPFIQSIESSNLIRDDSIKADPDVVDEDNAHKRSENRPEAFFSLYPEQVLFSSEATL